MASATSAASVSSGGSSAGACAGPLRRCNSRFPRAPPAAAPPQAELRLEDVSEKLRFVLVRLHVVAVLVRQGRH